MAAARATYAHGLGQPGVTDGGDPRGPRSLSTRRASSGGAELGVAHTQACSGRAAAAGERGRSVRPRVLEGRLGSAGQGEGGLGESGGRKGQLGRPSWAAWPCAREQASALLGRAAGLSARARQAARERKGEWAGGAGWAGQA